MIQHWWVGCGRHSGIGEGLEGMAERAPWCLEICSSGWGGGLQASAGWASPCVQASAGWASPCVRITSGSKSRRMEICLKKFPLGCIWSVHRGDHFDSYPPPSPVPQIPLLGPLGGWVRVPAWPQRGVAGRDKGSENGPARSSVGAGTIYPPFWGGHSRSIPQWG